MSQALGDLVKREQQARMDAEAANRTKDDFLALLSHELRTPLNAILGWASILSRGRHDPVRVGHAVRVIERNARTQVQMIEDLLDVSRIATGNQRLHFTDVSVAAAVDAALEVIRPSADAKGVEVRGYTEVTDRIVSVDGRRLQQILWNLLANAVRFTPRGGVVEVVACDAGGATEIRVKDTGAGIRAEFLPHVFERFRQGDSSTTRAHGGLGLGLAIVRDLIELHGGSVRAESEGEGHGATFTIRLPAIRTVTDVSGSAPRPARPMALSLSGAKVLVVDDDEDEREMLRAILEDAGASVATAGSAPETRTALETSHPDLLIADIGMSGEDGYSLIRSIRRLESNEARVPAIALIAHASPQDVELALSSGFQLHIAKPVDSPSLIAAIARLVVASPN
jgi:CheY-like chemotaxis protein/nitrogen-specific signal transduction histidine kinase